MPETPDANIPSTPSSVEATSQSSGPAPATLEPSPPTPTRNDNEAFGIGDGVERAVDGRPYERQDDRRLYRPLKIFALDPSVSRLQGATALVNVPYEKLEKGPKGQIFQVASDANISRGDLLDLDDHDILIRNGLDPSTSDKHFHDQMVYAVCSIVYTAFRTALGRHITWGFKKRDDRSQLLIRPRAFDGNNSHYDKSEGELCFGFFRSKAKGEFPGTVYACLSHDTVEYYAAHI